MELERQDLTKEYCIVWHSKVRRLPKKPSRIPNGGTKKAKYLVRPMHDTTHKAKVQAQEHPAELQGEPNVATFRKSKRPLRIPCWKVNAFSLYYFYCR